MSSARTAGAQPQVQRLEATFSLSPSHTHSIRSSPLLDETLREPKGRIYDNDQEDHYLEAYEMVQVYGVAPQDSADANVPTNGVEENGEGDESRALLTGRTVARATQKDKDGHASLLSCISNLSNTIIGSGASKYCYCGASPMLIHLTSIRLASRHAHLPSGAYHTYLVIWRRPYLPQSLTKKLTSSYPCMPLVILLSPSSVVSTHMDSVVFIVSVLRCLSSAGDRPWPRADCCPEW